MKKMIYMFAAVAVATAAMGCPAEAASMTVNAEAVAMKAPKGEIKTVVFVTNMHCQKCVNKVIATFSWSGVLRVPMLGRW